MNQYYVMEIQRYANGEYGHLVHFVYDTNPEKAKLKGESKYHEVLAAAAVSELSSHAAILMTAEGFPIYHQCYKHPAASEPVEEE